VLGVRQFGVRQFVAEFNRGPTGISVPKP